MMIEIQCGNFSKFDASLGRYVECGEKLIVSGDQVGQMVTCRKCHQQIEVPYGVGANGDPSQVAEEPVAEKATGKPSLASVSKSLDASTKNKPRPRSSKPTRQQKSQPGKSSSTERSAKKENQVTTRSPINRPIMANPSGALQKQKRRAKNQPREAILQ